jgi:toxin-antitoxin system PIN domain toxin
VFVVDTNVLIYAADVQASAHASCRAALLRWRERAEPWYLTWGIVYEFLRVTTHPKVFRKPWSAAQAWSFIDALLAAPGLALLVETEHHAAVLARLTAQLPDLSGNLVHDAHTAVLMLEHGIRTIYTRDTAFHRFPELQVCDPLRETAS